MNFGITKLSDAQEGTLKLVVKRSCEGTWKLSTCQPRSQCFSLLFYLLFFRDWNAVVQYHTIQCLLIFCNTYHRQPSVCFTEASRLSRTIFISRFRIGSKVMTAKSRKITQTHQIKRTYYPTELVIAQKTHETITNIPRYFTVNYCTVENQFDQFRCWHFPHSCHAQICHRSSQIAVSDICRLQTADSRLQIADCRMQTADCRLQTADCRLQTGYN